MMVTKFQMDAMSRADIPEHERKDFYLYVDEFQNFATDSFATILSEARKYKLNLVMANQYIDQMTESVK
jgi:type IV secretory pathway TraG/TraD family ATPase VirD4